MTMIHCTRCGRALKHASASGMGPKCAIAVLSAKPRRRQRVVRAQDERQPDLFVEARP